MISGAASGIGRGIAERCVSEGMKVVFADIDEAGLIKAETELKTAGGTVLGVRTDVSRRSDVERLAREAGLAAFKAAIEASMPPLQVADVVFDAIKKEQFYILPHPEWTKVIELRTDKLLRMENPQSPAATVAKLINLRGAVS